MFSPQFLYKLDWAEDLKLCSSFLGLLLLIVTVKFSQILVFHGLDGVVPAGARSREIRVRVVATGKVLLRVVGLPEARARLVEEVVLLRGLDVERFLEDLERTLLLLLLRSRDCLCFRSIKNVGLILLLLYNIKLFFRLLDTLQILMWFILLVILFIRVHFLFGVPIIFHQWFKHSLLNLKLNCILIDFVSDLIGVQILDSIFLEAKLITFNPAILAYFNLWL